MPFSFPGRGCPPQKGFSIDLSIQEIKRWLLEGFIYPPQADLVQLQHARPFVSALQSNFYLDSERVEQAIRERSCFNVIFLPTMFKVDIFVLGNDPLSRQEMKRRERVTLDAEEGISIVLASAEDTVLQKLIWFQAGGGVSDRQWEDLLGVLKVRREELDLGYLLHWAHHLELEELLARALRDAGITRGR